MRSVFFAGIGYRYYTTSEKLSFRITEYHLEPTIL